MDEEFGEKIKKGKKPGASVLTLQKAIDLGEYDPEFLASFPDWHLLGRHAQFQMIREALDNRRRQLVTSWAEINNVLDLRLKPELKEALKNIELQLKKLDDDWEELYLKYSKS